MVGAKAKGNARSQYEVVREPEVGTRLCEEPPEGLFGRRMEGVIL